MSPWAAAGDRPAARRRLLCALVAVLVAWVAPAAAAAQAASAAAAREVDALLGAWQRTDGGYIILVRSVGAFGQLDAIYINPRQVPFSKAVATCEGEVLRATFELRAGGYDGSVYELRYDRANDRLVGSFHQAVAQQRFDVVFERKRR